MKITTEIIIEPFCRVIQRVASIACGDRKNRDSRLNFLSGSRDNATDCCPVRKHRIVLRFARDFLYIFLSGYLTYYMYFAHLAINDEFLKWFFISLKISDEVHAIKINYLIKRLLQY